MTEREYQRNLQRIIERIFGPAGDKPRSRTDLLRLSKQYLRLKEARIRMRHDTGLSGRELCRMRSDMIDTLIRTHFGLAAAPSATPNCAANIAAKPAGAPMRLSAASIHSRCSMGLTPMCRPMA